ncbi:MAG: glycosyltransferase [Corynebacteriales bacterium]|nr:glycosyltransferase [Mycobacteriales bacterium]
MTDGSTPAAGARGLVITSPARGHLYPIVDAMLALRRRGHDIHIVTLASEVPMLADLGLSAAALPPELNDAELDDWRSPSRRERVRSIVAEVMSRIPTQFALADALIAERRPDLVVADFNAAGVQFAAERAGIPWAVWCPTFLPIFSGRGPMIGTGMLPGSGRRHRVRDEVMAFAGRALWDRLSLGPMNDARRSVGLPPIRHTDDLLRIAPLVINFVGPPIEHRRADWPDTLHLVGPSLWSPPAPVHPEIAAIDRPVALVTCSTEFQNDAHLAQTTLTALADTGLHVVVTCGDTDPAGFTRGPHTTILRNGPHDQILDKAVVAVTHGGLGVTQKAVARGVPVVVVPFGRDQHDVAARFAATGAGVRMSPGDLTPEAVHRAVLSALGRASAARAVAAQTDTDAGERAAVLIDDLIRRAT